MEFRRKKSKGMHGREERGKERLGQREKVGRGGGGRKSVRIGAGMFESVGTGSFVSGIFIWFPKVGILGEVFGACQQNVHQFSKYVLSGNWSLLIGWLWRGSLVIAAGLPLVLLLFWVWS